MNTTPFMDKQIMDLTHGSSTQSKDLLNLMKPQNHEDEEEEHHHQQPHVDDESRGNGFNTDHILPSYDFQPIRPLAASNFDSSPNFGAAFSKPWNSDSNFKPSTPIIKSYSSLDSIEPAKVVEKREPNTFESSVLSEIDLTMKKHTDNLLHILEGVSARLTQLETRTHQLENSIDDLKVAVGNNHGSTDGKLRQLENILQEVQTEVLNVKDKQDIMQAQLQLAKLQVSKTDQKSETQANAITDSVQLTASAPVQSQQLPSPVNLPQSIPVVPFPNAPPQPPPHQALPPSQQGLPPSQHSLPPSQQGLPPSQQGLPPSQQGLPPSQQGLPPSQQGLPPPAQPPNQYPHNQIPAVPQRDAYFPAPVQSQETPTQQYQLPLAQQPPHQPVAPPHQPYQQPPHSQYSQPAPHLPPQQPPMNPPQLQSSLGHHVEEPPYVPSQNYPPNLRQPPSQSQPPTGPPPSQQFYGAPPHGYEPPSGRSGSGYSSGYGTPSGSAEAYRYGGPPQYGGSSGLKPPQLPPASVASSGGSGYPQLPTARILPQALPTASAVSSGGSGSAGTGNKVSIDDVVDKVATMGFPRDHVRATVRKLTENGQSVDLNAVLDKLMNDGDVQPQRGWFGR